MLIMLLMLILLLMLIMVPRPRCGPPCRDKWRRFDAEAASGLWGKAWSAGDQLKSGDCRVQCCSHVVESRVGVQVNECIWSGDDWRKNGNVSGCRKVTIIKMLKCSNADIAEVDSTQLRLCSATGRASLFKTSAGSPHSPCVQRTGWISRSAKCPHFWVYWKNPNSKFQDHW